MIHNHEVPGSIPGPATEKTLQASSFFIEGTFVNIEGTALKLLISPLVRNFINPFRFPYH